MPSRTTYEALKSNCISHNMGNMWVISSVKFDNFIVLQQMGAAKIKITKLERMQCASTWYEIIPMKIYSVNYIPNIDKAQLSEIGV